MSEWIEHKLGDIASLEYGKGLKDYRDVEGKYDVFGTNGKIGFTDQFLYDQPSIIIGRKGAYRGVHLASMPFFVIDTAFYTKPRLEDLDMLFLYYWFKTIDINGMDSGSAIPSTSRDEVYELDITLPPLPEQQAIAAVLSSLDDKIDLLHRQNKTLEALAQTLFRHWFVDGAQDFVKLTEMVEINPTLSLRKGTLAPYLEMKNVQSDSCAPSDWYDRELNSGTRFQNGDTLMARITPCLENNKVAHVSFLDDGQVGWGSTEFLVLRAKGNLPKFYTYLLAKDSDFRAFAINSMTGSSGRQRVQTDSLYEYELGYPTENNLASFAEQIDPIEQKLQVNSKQIRTLEKLRDTLLPKLMSGEVRVRL